MLRRWSALARWQRYLVVFVLSFPFALGLRAVLQRVLPVDYAANALAYLRTNDKRPLSEPLAALLAEDLDETPTQPHPLLGRPAPDFALLDVDRKETRLSDHLRRGPVVVVFYYGYGCTHCVAQLFAVNEDIALFRELGAEVIAVSADTPEHTAGRYRRFGRFDFPVLSDPENQVAATYNVYDPKTESLAHGTFVIGPDGVVHWANRGGEPFLGNRTLLRVLARLRPPP